MSDDDDKIAKNALKGIIIQTIIVVISGIVSYKLSKYFMKKGFENMSRLSDLMMFTPLGFYFLFGKHIKIWGVTESTIGSKPFRIIAGLILILIGPVVFLLR